MHTSKLFAILAAALFTCGAYAQSPTSGRISGRTYLNSYFHVSYSWPAPLKPLPLPSSPASSNAKEYLFPLFTARQGDQPFGVVLVAEKLNVAGPHSSGIKSSGDFIDRLSGSLRPGPVLSNIVRTQKKNAHGRVFDELTYLQEGKPASVIATQVGQYLMVFKCSAQSQTDMARLEQSALALQVSQ